MVRTVLVPALMQLSYGLKAQGLGCRAQIYAGNLQSRSLGAYPLHESLRDFVANVNATKVRACIFGSTAAYS